ncbi:MAG: hypothetical protein LW850_17615 [Planctomycetaceae bacterium]|jgi:hypothetical protein|nr:hypothetical protein [Planctomycetaceae bacterium]MCE2812207.1 hypothetical protein [Planctomycetaceae bacterium]
MHLLITSAFVGILIIVILVWSTKRLELERRRKFLKRFERRKRIPYKEQIKSIQPFDVQEEVGIGWESICRILRIDPDLLRPYDRFDDILSEDPGFPVEGEFHELCDEIAMAMTATQYSGDVQTAIEAARILGLAEKLRRRDIDREKCF